MEVEKKYLKYVYYEEKEEFFIIDFSQVINFLEKKFNDKY